MSRFSRQARMAVAGVLLLSTAVVFAVSPASAAATGSLANDGNGGMVVTYSGAIAGDGVALEIHQVGSNCDPGNALAVLSAGGNVPPAAQMAASPATIVVGTTAYELSPALGATFTVAAIAYEFCLFGTTGQGTLIDQLTMTIGQVSPTTTSTTTAPSTTTTAAGTPVAPAFTG